MTLGFGRRGLHRPIAVLPFSEALTSRTTLIMKVAVRPPLLVAADGMGRRFPMYRATGPCRRHAAGRIAAVKRAESEAEPSPCRRLIPVQKRWRRAAVLWTSVASPIRPVCD